MGASLEQAGPVEAVRPQEQVCLVEEDVDYLVTWMVSDLFQPGEQEPCPQG